MDFKRALGFLTKLKKNNNKEWFDKNRAEYDAVRADATGLVERLLKGIKIFDPTLAAQEPKHSMFRINRDIRFSKDKTPYKTNIGLSFSKGGKSSPSAGYYFHIEPGEAFLGGGVWNPEPEHLAAIRQEIDYNFDEFKRIINAKPFKTLFGKLQGETTTRLPKGYTADNPAIEFLKHKSFLMGLKLTNKDLESKDLEKKVLSTFKVMKPMIDFLNRAMLA
jgi:uncharacterized protein (TIGR02453 family)